ncbi:hypothetical protein [Allobranchiibius sp. CTAmp26]|uniref:hypothetical protein n=1 Tax=Allobranchiibius sp. CTAmp26 TaxID=2815214 RepID=UPI001AA0CF29|nr:hypothetical protein [Allobranchiibius sp. CTAmp26]MBO1756053.1 hypothetical protein [Allobranchiibius sp. CTAmp26]
MLAAVLAFIGALLGAGIPALIALRGQHQQARTEWSHRLDRAIHALSSPDPEVRDVGKELLASLIESDLGSAADRELARRIARTGLMQDAVDTVDRPRENENDVEEDR